MTNIWTNNTIQVLLLNLIVFSSFFLKYFPSCCWQFGRKHFFTANSNRHDLSSILCLQGNVLWIVCIVKVAFGGRTYAQRVKNLNAHLIQWYKDTKESMRIQGGLTLEKLRPKKSWPKLKAKAAATRHLAGYALHLITTFSDDSDADKLAILLCTLLVRFYYILQREGIDLSRSAKRELPKLGQLLAQTYNSLATLAFECNQLLWKLTPKLHLWEHLTEYQCIVYGNPRFWWTYCDEDLVGTLISTAESLHPSTMPVNTLFKWLHLIFEDEMMPSSG